LNRHSAYLEPFEAIALLFDAQLANRMANRLYLTWLGLAVALLSNDRALLRPICGGVAHEVRTSVPASALGWETADVDKRH
jgi:uncharacterized protein YcbX